MAVHFVALNLGAAVGGGGGGRLGSYNAHRSMLSMAVSLFVCVSSRLSLFLAVPAAVAYICGDRGVVVVLVSLLFVRHGCHFAAATLLPPATQTLYVRILKFATGVLVNSKP